MAVKVKSSKLTTSYLIMTSPSIVAPTGKSIGPCEQTRTFMTGYILSSQMSETAFNLNF